MEGVVPTHEAVFGHLKKALHEVGGEGAVEKMGDKIREAVELSTGSSRHN